MITNYKEILDNETRLTYTTNSNGVKRKISFRIAECLHIEDHVDDIMKTKLDRLKKKLGSTNYNKAKKYLIRFSFLIQTTDNTPGVESDTTLYRTRWSEVLTTDSRYASFDECYNVFTKLLDELLTFSDQEIEDIFKFYKHSDNYLPVDYISNNLDKIHIASNIEFQKDDLYKSYSKVKSIIFNKDINDHIEQFRDFLKKIKVKSYKTDRSKTGNYKTNRELRWEALPTSHQFAFFRDCVAIEYKLLLQICSFKNVEKS